MVLVVRPQRRRVGQAAQAAHAAEAAHAVIRLGHAARDRPKVVLQLLLLLLLLTWTHVRAPPQRDWHSSAGRQRGGTGQATAKPTAATRCGWTGLPAARTPSSESRLCRWRGGGACVHGRGGIHC